MILKAEDKEKILELVKRGKNDYGAMKNSGH